MLKNGGDMANARRVIEMFHRDHPQAFKAAVG